MKAWPTFKFKQRGDFGEWTGTLQPVRNTTMFPLILDDLRHNRTVYVADGGEILHYNECGERHCRHPWMDRITDPMIRFMITVRYTGGQALPRAFVNSPDIRSEQRAHMWPDGAICAFNAADNVWFWDRDTVGDFLRHVSIWLVKWLVFSQSGVWIGAQHVSSPENHLALIPETTQCWCGSGSPYGTCCRPRDLAIVASQRVMVCPERAQ